MSSSTAFNIALAGLTMLCFLPYTTAFGAGNIPSYSHMEHIAFRHGDIEDILLELVKKAAVGGAAASVLSGLSGFLSELGSSSSGSNQGSSIAGKKFGPLDLKRVYFGNWLRDYSQAMDVAGLAKLSVQGIINVVMVLGFLAHGYATEEFQVTPERLGVYLPVEHIDNPRGYNENKDARQVHPSLRPPVEEVELEVDPRTGMLNYIANEQGHWDTSAAFVRRNVFACIDAGRRARQSKSDPELWEAYRLLGTFLHTLEDFSAHSNYLELALKKLGHDDVFCHVGRNAVVRDPQGQMVPYLVTGSFGGSDFIHSLLGESSDKISEASLTTLDEKVSQASNSTSTFEKLHSLLGAIPSGSGGGGNLSRELEDVHETTRAQNPNELSPEEMYQTIWKIFTLRDHVMKFISETLEKIPGLNKLIDDVSESVQVFVLKTLQPYVLPIMSQATTVLKEGSEVVVDNPDQYRVFDDDDFWHPTHSLLAKDHFSMILNEPAGKVARVVVRHAVEDIVRAWDDVSIDPNQVVHHVLETFHHPFFSSGSRLQDEMLQTVREWLNTQDRHFVLNALTKQAVRDNKNHRQGSEKYIHQHPHGHGGAHPHSHQEVPAYARSIDPSYGQSSYSQSERPQQYGQSGQDYQQSSHHQYQRSQEYEQPSQGYEQQYQQRESYGQGAQSGYEQPQYGEQRQHHQHQQQQQNSYGGDRENSSSYGHSGNGGSYGGQYASEGYSSNTNSYQAPSGPPPMSQYEQPSYQSGGYNQQNEYGQQNHQEPRQQSYGYNQGQESYGNNSENTYENQGGYQGGYQGHHGGYQGGSNYQQY